MSSVTETFKTLIFLPVTHPEVERGFQALPGGPEAWNPAYGEGWQYMGTARVDTGRLAGRWQSEFRHRAHPSTGQREYRAFPSVLTDAEAQGFPGM